MFSKAAVLAIVSFALSVAAVSGGSDYECNTDKIYCCEQIQESQSKAGAEIAKTIAGLDVQTLTGRIGAACSPITVVGASDGGTWLIYFLLCAFLTYSMGIFF